MAADSLKRKLQMAVQSYVGSTADLGHQDTFIDWFNKSSKHIIVCEGKGEYDPKISSASYTHFISRWVEDIAVYDPILFIDRFYTLDPTISKIVYIYDIDLLGSMPEYEALKFLSYVKYALMIGIRVVMSMNCEFKIASIDHYFKNKKTADRFMFEMCNSQYCTILEI